jgi:hypothetical protein
MNDGEIEDAKDLFIGEDARCEGTRGGGVRHKDAPYKLGHQRPKLKFRFPLPDGAIVTIALRVK